MLHFMTYEFIYECIYEFMYMNSYYVYEFMYPGTGTPSLSADLTASELDNND